MRKLIIFIILLTIVHQNNSCSISVFKRLLRSSYPSSSSCGSSTPSSCEISRILKIEDFLNNFDINYGCEYYMNIWMTRKLT